MKRFFILLLALAMLLSLWGCGAVEISGIENYRKEECPVSLTKHLFPSDDFLTKFQYDSGEYAYRDADDPGWGYVTAFSQLSYEEKTYEEAKDFCLFEFSCCDAHQYEYGGYVFFEILCHKKTDDSGNSVVACNYPKHFNMFAYNDAERTLMFLGYYNGNPNDTEKELAEKDFGAFMEAVFPNTK